MSRAPNAEAQSWAASGLRAYAFANIASEVAGSASESACGRTDICRLRWKAPRSSATFIDVSITSGSAASIDRFVAGDGRTALARVSGTRASTTRQRGRGPLDECEKCAQSTSGPCLRCRRRAQRIVDALESGITMEAAADAENVTIVMARELIAEEHDRRAMAATSVPPVANDRLRKAFWHRYQSHEHYTTVLAEAGGWASPIDPLRLLGVVATSDRTIRGVVYAGGFLTHVTPAAAGRLAVAMGLMPRDFD